MKPWRAAVAAEVADALHAAHAGTQRLDAAWTVDLVFTMQRPRNHYRGGKHADELRADAPFAPAVTPDLDKLIRSTLDGLADGGAVPNDSHVVELHAVKTYPAGHIDALDSPGVVITLREAARP